MLVGRFEALVLAILRGVVKEIFDVVDDGDVEGAARASSDLLAQLEVLLGDLEQVPAWTRVRVSLQLLVPLHVLDLHLIVRHRFARAVSSFFLLLLLLLLRFVWTVVFGFSEERRMINERLNTALGFARWLLSYLLFIIHFVPFLNVINRKSTSSMVHGAPFIW